jgi:hypothetical protein
MSDFLGIHKSNDKLPEQFPFHGGRFTLMASWYSDHIQLDPISRSVLKEIIGYLNFNNFYEPREIRQTTLIQGTGWCRCSVINAIKELNKRGIISIKKGLNNKNFYKLEKTMPDAYEDYLKNMYPHKFNKNQKPEKTKSIDKIIDNSIDYDENGSLPDRLPVVSNVDYDKKYSLCGRPPVVYDVDYPWSTTQTTSSLSPPNYHPNNFNDGNSDENSSSLGRSPQTPKNEPDDILCLEKKMKRTILERIVSQKDGKLFITSKKRSVVLSEIANDFDIELLKKAEQFYTENKYLMVKCNEVCIREHLDSFKSNESQKEGFTTHKKEDLSRANILAFEKIKITDDIPF